MKYLFLVFALVATKALAFELLSDTELGDVSISTRTTNKVARAEVLATTAPVRTPEKEVAQVADVASTASSNSSAITNGIRIANGISSTNGITMELSLLQSIVPFNASVVVNDVEWQSGTGGLFSLVPTPSTDGISTNVAMPAYVGSIGFQNIRLGTDAGPSLGSVFLLGLKTQGSTITMTLR